MLLPIIVSLICVGIVYKVLDLFNKHRRYAHIPGPKRDSFFYGNGPSFRESLEKHGCVGVYWLDMYKKYGQIYHYFLVTQPRVFIADPLVIKEIVTEFKLFPRPEDLQGGYRKFFSFGISKMGFTNFCGFNSLLTSKGGPIWKKKKKIMDPTFSLQALSKHLPRFYNIAVGVADCLEAIQQENLGKPVDIKSYISPFTIDAISYAGFGASDDEVSQLRTHNGNMGNAMVGVRSKGGNPLSILLDSSVRKHISAVQRDLKTLRGIGKEMILDRIQNGKYGKVKDILDTIIAANTDDETGALQMEMALDEFMAMYAAGNGTTSTTLLWALSSLTRNPHVMEKLIEEVDHVWTPAEINNSTDFSEIARVLKEMTYLEAVVKETLRYNPPVQFVFRKNSQTVNLCGYDIPAGTILNGSQYVMHRSDKFWDKPDEFNPDRFISSQPKPYTYFPFFLGPRQCIGKNFAILELKCILCEVLKRLTIELDPASPKIQKVMQGLLVFPVGNSYIVHPRVN